MAIRTPNQKDSFNSTRIPDFRYNPTQIDGEMAEWLKAAVC
jgi:hypothetical protein